MHRKEQDESTYEKFAKVLPLWSTLLPLAKKMMYAMI
jgi:hypothetical protein